MHHIYNELADMVWVRRIERVHWTAQGRGHDSGPPGMSALAPDNGLGAQHAGRVDNTSVDFLQVGKIQEQAEIAALITIGAGCPTDAQEMEQLGIANHCVGIGKIVG